MDDNPVVIIGAGPAGLAAGYELISRNIYPVILERDAIVGGIAQTEYFQIYNSSSSSVDIFGYTITDGDGFTYTFPAMTGVDEFLLPKGEYAYVFLYSTFVNDPTNYDIYIGNTFYLFTDVEDTVYPAPPSEQFGDPDYTLAEDRADQLTLKDAGGITQDYVAWSSEASPSIDFLSDDSAAVSQGVWQENAYRDVAGITKGTSIKRDGDGFDTNEPSDWIYSTTTLWTPALLPEDDPVLLTPVGISYFEAKAENGEVILRWETSFEKGTVGFYLFRKNSKQYMYELVNEKLIPALIGSPLGGTYQYHDETAVPGENYSYLIEEVVDTGERIEYGPYNVKPRYTNNSEHFNLELIRTVRETPSFGKKRQEFLQRITTRSNKANRSKPIFVPNSSQLGSLKISIIESGLYFISFSDIANNFGLDLKKTSKLLRSHRMKLTSQGKSIPYIVDRKKKGIYFYGFEHKDTYTDENIFWLTTGMGLRMKNANLRRTPSKRKNQSFTDSIHFEEDNFPVYSQPWENTYDYWAWGYSFCGYENLDLQTYTFKLNDIVPTKDNAAITLHLIGGSMDGAGDDHLAEVSLNDSRIGDCSWKGIDLMACELSIPQNLLTEEGNILEVKGVLIGDAGFSLFYLDSFDVHYKRYYKSAGNSLQFHGDTNKSVIIGGFDSSKTFLLDVSNPFKPKYARRLKAKKLNGSYWLSFIPDSPSANYLALSSSALKQVDGIELVTPAGLKKTHNAADYLIITPAELKDSVQELADYRSGQGYKVKIVELDEIINEFNDGLYSPMAIKKFLAYTHSNWRRTPQFVLLVGDTNYDYRNIEGYGTNLMPTFLISSQYGFFASDGYMADVDNDNIPDMAIGRLPVVTSGELQDIILKIKVYEYSTEHWKKKTILLADEPDGEFNFAWDSEQVSHLFPPEYSQKRIYLSNYSINDARRELFAELLEGAAFVNYFGHGGPDRLTQDGLLLSDDIGTLSTNGGAPVVTAMTCAAGEFIFTNFDTLAELLLLQPNGGATAVWSASGLSKNHKAVRLDTEFYKTIYNDGYTVLGKAILKSLENYSHIDDDPYHLLIYNLLGDPALKIR